MIELPAFPKGIFYEQAELTKDDCVIITGDFGGVWDGGAEERHWLDWMEAKSFTSLFVSGNHENFDMLAELPIEDWHGGNVQRIRPSVIHLLRGQIYDIQGCVLPKLEILLQNGAQGAIPESQRPGKGKGHAIQGDVQQGQQKTGDQRHSKLDIQNSPPRREVHCAARIRWSRSRTRVGLKWTDIDLNKGIIHVRRQILRQNGTVVEAPLKTKNSYRNIAIGTDTVEILSRMKRSDEYVFPSPNGGLMSPDGVLHMLQRVLKRAGLERIRFTDPQIYTPYFCSASRYSMSNRTLTLSNYAKQCNSTHPYSLSRHAHERFVNHKPVCMIGQVSAGRRKKAARAV